MTECEASLWGFFQKAALLLLTFESLNSSKYTGKESAEYPSFHLLVLSTLQEQSGWLRSVHGSQPPLGLRTHAGLRFLETVTPLL